MRWTNKLGVALFVPLLALGCESEQQRADTESAMEEPNQTLSEDRLEELRSRFAVLGEEPAPEPRPNGDRGTPPETLPDEVLEQVRGEATFYADTFEGRRTASGIPFRQNQMVAAHRAYPFGTILRVTNLSNERSVNVRVVDRGPHGSRAAARNTILDLSRRAAEQLGYVNAGRAQVEVEVLEWGQGLG